MDLPCASSSVVACRRAIFADAGSRVQRAEDEWVEVAGGHSRITAEAGVYEPVNRFVYFCVRWVHAASE